MIKDGLLNRIYRKTCLCQNFKMMMIYTSLVILIMTCCGYCIFFIECTDGLYGENCAYQCKCGRGFANCDHITGCECKSGWTGPLCDTDINECNNTINLCGDSLMECINKEGSYMCTCKDGFINTTYGCQGNCLCKRN